MYDGVINVIFPFNFSIQVIEDGVGRHFPEFLEESISIIAGFIISLIINWKLTLVLSPFVFFVLISTALVIKQVRFSLLQMQHPLL